MEENYRPKVSVCIPTYNGANYLPHAVASVIGQTYSDYEIVIVDNNSCDETDVVAKNLCQIYSGLIRYYRNTTNLGLAGNLNQCILHARGDYIKLLCVDDLLLPQCLEASVHALDTYPSVALVTGWRLMINEDDVQFDIRVYKTEDCIIDGKTAITQCLYSSNYIGEPPAVMFRKGDFSKLASGFKASLPQLMDMDLWFRLLEAGNLFNLGRPVCSIRVHYGQLTKANTVSGALVQDNIKVFNEFSQKLYISTTRRRRFQQRLMMTYRIWCCRESLSAAERRELLISHAYKILYPFMSLAPLAARLAAVKRRLVH
jgi:glycosyltransferase involved in cell wall biosynthesis